MAIEFTAGDPNQDGPAFWVEAGDYECVVIDAKEKKSKNTGAPMMELKCRIIFEDGNEGPSFFDYLVFSANVMWKIDSFLQATGRHPGEGVGLSIEANDLIGHAFWATLSVDEFNGKRNNKVKAYIAANDVIPAAAPLPPTRAASPPQARPGAALPPIGLDDDEIPF